jgi:uncharacterized membrane protein
MILTVAVSIVASLNIRSGQPARIMVAIIAAVVALIVIPFVAPYGRRFPLMLRWFVVTTLLIFLGLMTLCSGVAGP